MELNTPSNLKLRRMHLSPSLRKIARVCVLNVSGEMPTAQQALKGMSVPIKFVTINTEHLERRDECRIII